MNKINSQKGSVLIIAIVVVAILILGGLGYVVWNNFLRTTNETTQNADTNQDTNTDVKKDIKTTLPNGKTATYPDTEENRNITFRSAENGNPNSTYIFISHKAYDEYLASLGEAKVDELCGQDDGLKALKDNINFGLLNTSHKTITPPQNWNCVQLIASNENPEVSLRPGAQAVLDTVSADIDAFLKMVTIQ